MSNTIRRYYDDTHELTLTAFVGKNWDKSIQFAIGSNFVGLSSNQLEDMINIIKKRLKTAKNYSGTSNLPDDEVDYKE
jgi:hypothetical protein